MYGIRMSLVEVVDAFLAVAQVPCRLPAVFAVWVAFPLDEILYIPIMNAGVEDGFDFVLVIAVDDNGVWFGGVALCDSVRVIGDELGCMVNRVYAVLPRQLKSKRYGP